MELFYTVEDYFASFSCLLGPAIEYIKRLPDQINISARMSQGNLELHHSYLADHGMPINSHPWNPANFFRNKTNTGKNDSANLSSVKEEDMKE
ncbi:MAG: hypothetical protein QNJ17_02375 [Desulfocapsaceae bacterium]|nr:hypothetical protein [Desulfocapsaceae bacterium]